MCLNSAEKLGVSHVTGFKVVQKVKNGFRPVFDAARKCDSRIYKTGKQYSSSSFYNPFHALSLIGAKKFYNQLMGKLPHDWDVPVEGHSAASYAGWNGTFQRGDLRIVIVELTEELKYEARIYEEPTQYRSWWTNDAICGKKMTIICAADKRLYMGG